MDEKETNRDSAGKFIEGNEYRIQKGEVRNPSGRPKGKNITTYLRELLDQDTSGGRKIADALAIIMVREAEKGNYQFFREILERTEGKVADRITGDSDGGLTVIFKRADDSGSES